MRQPLLGQLWGIGVGPGDSELMTVKGLRQLQSAPVVAFPAGRHGQPGIAERIIADVLQPHQIRLALYLPYVQDPQVLQAAWENAAQQVWDHLCQGQDVVFATEGDASFYSTFTYLAQTVSQHHPDIVIHTVPGVCSPLAAAAMMGHPLTILDQRLAILPALYTIADLNTALDHNDVVVLLKVASVYRQVWSILQARSLLAHSCVVIKASQPDQMIYRDLTSHPDLELPYFSLLMINCGG